MCLVPIEDTHLAVPASESDREIREVEVAALERDSLTIPVLGAVRVEPGRRCQFPVAAVPMVPVKAVTNEQRLDPCAGEAVETRMKALERIRLLGHPCCLVRVSDDHPFPHALDDLSRHCMGSKDDGVLGTVALVPTDVAFFPIVSAAAAE